jgi:hypothetical protein
MLHTTWTIRVGIVIRGEGRRNAVRDWIWNAY